MRKRLTKLTLEQRPPKVGRLELRDSESPLVFRLTSAGARTLSVRTRLRGRQVRFTCPHPARVEKLDEARKWAHSIVQQCAAGVDPREEERRARAKAQATDSLLFANVVALFMERHAKNNRSWPDTASIFKVHVLPKWGSRAITDIKRVDVAKLLDTVEDRTSIYRANRVLAAVRKLFNWAAVRGMIENSPVGLGMTRSGEESRDRYLDVREIRLVWKAAEAIGYPAGTLYQLLLVTGQRRSEVAAMRWDEISRSDKLWTLKKERTKASREHLVPLSDLALKLIGSSTGCADYVLSTRDGRPISGFSKWKKDLDAKVLELAREEAEAHQCQFRPVPYWRLHDLRRTVGTQMEELSIPPHIVGSVLNHSPRGYKGITSVYTRGDLVYERRQALTTWARFLSLLVDASDYSSIEKLLRPHDEEEARRTAAFRRALQSDSKSWERERKRLRPEGASP